MLHLEKRLIGKLQRAIGDVEENIEISSLSKRCVVFVTQAVVQRQIRTNLPLILRVTNVILLFGATISGRTTVEWRRCAHVTEILDGRGRVCQQCLKTIENVGGTPESVCVDSARSKLDAKLVTVIPLGPTETVEERKRIHGIWLTATVRRAVSSNQASGSCCPCRCPLPGNRKVGSVPRNVDYELGEVDAIDGRGLPIRSCKHSVVTKFEFI